MNARWNSRLTLVVCAALLVAALAISTHFRVARAEGGDTPFNGARYDVGESDGANLIVTDNKSNAVYFYTIDQDKEVGAPLKLRGTIDLNQVGKETIQPTKAGK